MIRFCLLIIILFGVISETIYSTPNKGSCTIERIDWSSIDDTGRTPVDKTLNLLISQNDSLSIPTGTYLLNNELIIQHPCVINCNDAILISQTTDSPAAIIINAPGVEVSNLQVECDNKASKFEGRIHGFVINGDNFHGKGIVVSNSNQNAFDIRGTGCVLEHCKAVNPGYAGFRTINVLKGKMKKEDAWCKIMNCKSIQYNRKGYVNNGGMGILTIDGFEAVPKNNSSEAAILLESNETSHNYEAYISNVTAVGIKGNVIKQKAFERAIYNHCVLESMDGAVLRLHPHRNTTNGERNAYVEVSNCTFTGAKYCINGTADVQSLNAPDSILVRNSVLRSNGARIVDVIKNNVYIVKTSLYSTNSNSTAVIVRSPNVATVNIEDCKIIAAKVYGYEGDHGKIPGRGIFHLYNTSYSGKLFGAKKFDSIVDILRIR